MSVFSPPGRFVTHIIRCFFTSIVSYNQRYSCCFWTTKRVLEDFRTVIQTEVSCSAGSYHYKSTPMLWGHVRQTNKKKIPQRTHMAEFSVETRSRTQTNTNIHMKLQRAHTESYLKAAIMTALPIIVVGTWWQKGPRESQEGAASKPRQNKRLVTKNERLQRPWIKHKKEIAAGKTELGYERNGSIPSSTAVFAVFAGVCVSSATHRSAYTNCISCLHSLVAFLKSMLGLTTDVTMTSSAFVLWHWQQQSHRSHISCVTLWERKRVDRHGDGRGFVVKAKSRGKFLAIFKISIQCSQGT